jgi:hypothetical protein
METTAAAVSTPLPAAPDPREADAADERAAAHAESVMTQHAESGAPDNLEAVAAEHLELADATVASDFRELPELPERPEPSEPSELSELSELSEPSAPPRLPPPSSPAEARLGAEGLGRLRARYAEVMARIAEKATDEPAREELKAAAARLNPDAWVTADEVGAALEQYESVFESLRAVVGRHPPRRRRRR